MSGNLDEMAHGIVAALGTAPEPEPLPVSLRGQTYEQAIYLAQAIADECSAAGTPLAKIEIGEPGSFAGLGFERRQFDGGTASLEVNALVGSALHLYRWNA